MHATDVIEQFLRCSMHPVGVVGAETRYQESWRSRCTDHVHQVLRAPHQRSLIAQLVVSWYAAVQWRYAFIYINRNKNTNMKTNKNEMST